MLFTNHLFPHKEIKNILVSVQSDNYFNDLKLKILSKLEKTPWNRYPDLKANNLMEKITQILNCSSNQIVLGKGSNEVIQSIITSIISTNDKVCVLNPTFPIYKMITNQNDGIIIESKLDEEFKINEKDLLEKALQSKITILCNPNSPTGSLISLDIIEKSFCSIFFLSACGRRVALARL